MTIRNERRHWLKTSAALAAAPLLPNLALAQERRFEPVAGAWRSFELTTTVNVADVKGATQLWLPIPDVDTDWQRPLANSWTGNASTARIAADPKRGVRMLHATFSDATAAPTLTLVSTVQTRNRSTDWDRKAAVAAVTEDPAVLKASLAPTELIPTDGIVRQTALEATRGAASDVDKTRAIYQWVIEHAHREPKTRGCGTGDIKAMLETGNLGGKCADLNALFVGMCRASGIPARDVYGIRVAKSAFGYKELGAGNADITRAQHCRAETWLAGYGWVAMDPADVAKVMRQETASWIKDPKDALVAPVYGALFGAWEGNWMGYNDAHDLALPGAAGAPVPFLMYPQAEARRERADSLDPDTFKYRITAREITA
jgi:transglutaminase-like putative cysteine protease